MKHLKKIFFSTRTMTVLLLLYGVAMAVATFVENDYDTATAKVLIYNSGWFEILMLWLIVIFTTNIKTYRLTKKEKWPLLAFHLAFIFIFLGGAITRYGSFEGQMPIKEKQTTDEIISDLTYFKLDVSDGRKTLRFDKYPYLMSYFNAKDARWPFKRTFKQDFQFEGKTISLKTLDYIPLARDSIQESESGTKMVNIVAIGQGGRENYYMSDGELKNIEGTMFSFNRNIPSAIQLFEKDGRVMLHSPYAGKYMSMGGQQKGVVTDTALLATSSGDIGANEPVPIGNRTLYNINNTNFVIPRPPFYGKMVYYKGDRANPIDKNLLGAIQVELSSGKEKDTLWVKGGKGVTANDALISINGLNVSLGFGSKVLHTPFSLRCDDFLLDRYPGSNNPSSYESYISVVDKGKEDQHHIYMNNVMDYKGYRFFQASYFPDESGTILSVNADRWGTIVTYLGYFLLFTGMFFSLLWKGTRFWKLNMALKKMHAKSVFFILLISLLGVLFGQNTCFAQSNRPATEVVPPNEKQEPGPTAQFARTNELGLNEVINADHAAKFGRLLVQDFQGRIEPLNTLTLDLLRKLYKKDSYRKDGTTYSPDQWFISMQIDPGFWSNEPLIKVGQKGGDELLRETGSNAEGYTSYANLVNPNTGNFILEEQYNRSFSKRKAEQSNYDKSLIEVTERFNIFSNIAYGYFTKIIPVKNDPTQTWRSWIYSSEESPVQIDHTAYPILTEYFNAAKEGLKTGNWTHADNAIQSIGIFQQTWGKDVVPPELKVGLEILYNHLNVFFWLMIIYSFLGVVMLMLGFAEVFSSGSKFNHVIQLCTKFLLGIIVVTLVVQGIALAVRWYLSGHAPWSNGYEAIVFISGIGVLSGLLLYRNRNAFIPAAGIFVAMIMMGFANGGSMLDPQITPLEPVLKSYWLMIHVGIITSSYGFFGLSAVLSSISLILYSLNFSKKIDQSIKELTIVNEMALTVGLFALTVGTFLGGMWANESWGRYWSWDPKETWAFISVIFYAVVLHLRLVPKLRGGLTFNITSLWAIWSIIFTYFGVNYYLMGLHSYAAGDPIPVPSWIYITAAGMLVLSATAYFRSKKFRKSAAG